MTAYLLDTHVLLWANVDPDRLSPAAVDVLQNPSSELLVSVIAAVEIEIKRSIGKLIMEPSSQELVDHLLGEWLPLQPEHAVRLRDLPNLHRDPFDRLMITQAMVEDVTLITADHHILQYPVRTLEA